MPATVQDSGKGLLDWYRNNTEFHLLLARFPDCEYVHQFRWSILHSWTARRSNQSILKEISPEYSLEGLMLKLKHQYFGYLMWRADSLEKTLMLGKIEGRRRRGRQRMRWLDGIPRLNGHGCRWTAGVGDGQGGLVCCGSWCREESDMTERLNWTELAHWKWILKLWWIR